MCNERRDCRENQLSFDFPKKHHLRYDFHVIYTETEKHFIFLISCDYLASELGPYEYLSHGTEANTEKTVNFTTFKLVPKGNLNPEKEIQEFLSMHLNGNYNVTMEAEQITISYYQSNVGKILQEYNPEKPMERTEYKKKSKNLKIAKRNYKNDRDFKRRGWKNVTRGPKQSCGNIKIKTIFDRRFKELYQSDFIRPILLVDRTNERPFKALSDFIKYKVPKMIEAELNLRRKIVLYSDASLKHANLDNAYLNEIGKFVASNLIFTENSNDNKWEGIICSYPGEIINEKYKNDSTIAEIGGIAIGCKMLKNYIDIESKEIVFKVDNETVKKRLISYKDNPAPEKYKILSEIFSGLPIAQCTFEKASEKSDRLFSIVDGESKFYNGISTAKVKKKKK